MYYRQPQGDRRWSARSLARRFRRGAARRGLGIERYAARGVQYTARSGYALLLRELNGVASGAGDSDLAERGRDLAT